MGGEQQGSTLTAEVKAAVLERFDSDQVAAMVEPQGEEVWDQEWEAVWENALGSPLKVFSEALIDSGKATRWDVALVVLGATEFPFLTNPGGLERIRAVKVILKAALALAGEDGQEVFDQINEDKNRPIFPLVRAVTEACQEVLWPKTEAVPGGREEDQARIAELEGKLEEVRSHLFLMEIETVLKEYVNLPSGVQLPEKVAAALERFKTAEGEDLTKEFEVLLQTVCDDIGEADSAELAFVLNILRSKGEILTPLLEELQQRLKEVESAAAREESATDALLALQEGQITTLETELEAVNGKLKEVRGKERAISGQLANAETLNYQNQVTIQDLEEQVSSLREQLRTLEESDHQVEVKRIIAEAWEKASGAWTAEALERAWSIRVFGSFFKILDTAAQGELSDEERTTREIAALDLLQEISQGVSSGEIDQSISGGKLPGLKRRMAKAIGLTGEKNREARESLYLNINEFVRRLEKVKERGGLQEIASILAILTALEEPVIEVSARLAELTHLLLALDEDELRGQFVGTGQKPGRLAQLVGLDLAGELFTQVLAVKGYATTAAALAVTESLGQGGEEEERLKASLSKIFTGFMDEIYTALFDPSGSRDLSDLRQEFVGVDEDHPGRLTRLIGYEQAGRLFGRIETVINRVLEEMGVVDQLSEMIRERLIEGGDVKTQLASLTQAVIAGEVKASDWGHLFGSEEAARQAIAEATKVKQRVLREKQGAVADRLLIAVKEAVETVLKDGEATKALVLLKEIGAGDLVDKLKDRALDVFVRVQSDALTSAARYPHYENYPEFERLKAIFGEEKAGQLITQVHEQALQARADLEQGVLGQSEEELRAQLEAAAKAFEENGDWPENTPDWLRTTVENMVGDKLLRSQMWLAVGGLVNAVVNGEGQRVTDAQKRIEQLLQGEAGEAAGRN
ncbi:hypothetical protein KKD62_03825 [Patescibacteria group bacterium]|nr:hypothetical protein [Patescibacteria group bacterium]MBU1931135.1 hypothetical protein [Patescibacteria group bacterium]